MILLENKYVTVEHHETEKCISYVWKGFVPSEPLRGTMHQILDWINEYGVIGLISNATYLEAIGSEDQKWLGEKFVSDLAKSSLKLSAIVLPISVFGKMTNKVIEQKIGENSEYNLITKHFDNQQKALDWVRDMQKDK